MLSIDIQKLQKVLYGREQRVKLQRELLKNYKVPLISFTLNIPGPEKNSILFNEIHSIGVHVLEKELEDRNIHIVYSQSNSSFAGLEKFLCVDWDVDSIKRLTVSIEQNHDLGRLFDFDILSEDGHQISRESLGLQGRKCLLCGEKPIVCIRSKKHSLDELLNAVHAIIRKYELNNNLKLAE
ncbi:citrate lyase holo-[acyl-carrier protein] synthase [Alkalithermobacter paradoxus]|uniref:citrate lyase holo-[acyl-carrier protein] synthase n=1 Tax=Alkalithermobacter paradoxus TaxID=29349 RepID=A0A1V4IA00_9FIRM|nr:Apo-citrate lyase phosphoribosyl-dephospho-CoA transferase [[Clostridium] thermoalcaliphilum]